MIHMSKNPEFAKHASDLARGQDSIRSSNEDLIKLTQRFGRMMPRLQKLDPSAILTWFGLYNKIKDCARKADCEIAPLLNNDLLSANSVLQSQINYYCAQRQTSLLQDGGHGRHLKRHDGGPLGERLL